MQINSKSQTPNSKQAPIIKMQMFQTNSFGFDYWNLGFGDWDLEF